MCGYRCSVRAKAAAAVSLIGVAHLEVIAFAVICHSEEVAVVVDEVPPSGRRRLQDLSNDLREVLVLGHVSRWRRL